MEALRKSAANGNLQNRPPCTLGGGYHRVSYATKEKRGIEISEYGKHGQANRTVGVCLGTSAQAGSAEGCDEKHQPPTTGRRLMNAFTLGRWTQISQLFGDARKLMENEHAGCLNEARAGDSGPHTEVHSLLAMREHAVEFLGRPVINEVTQQLKSEPGSLLGRQLGPYQVLSLLGRGGMGEVYKARDIRSEQIVALKILPADMAVKAERLKRLQHEARAISALNHPHICKFYDLGEYRGRPFLVMEYLAGETLAERLKKGPLPLEEALEIGAEVADALEAAHQQGILHRDLKPGNVMLTSTGAKLFDFGLAKLKKQEILDHPTAETVTETMPGLVMGTLQYMSPEQLEGRPVDARTDLWGLGVTLYEMFTGRLAFDATSQARVIAAILEHEPAPLTTSHSPIPPPLDRLVRQCLAKSPEDRWTNAHDLADQLRAIRRKTRAMSLTSTAMPLLAKLKWAAIGSLIFVALAVKANAGL